MQKKLFASRIEELTTQQSEEELFTKANKQKINKNKRLFKRKRILSTTDESQQSPIRNKMIKVEADNNLYKKRTESCTKDESKEQFSKKNKTQKSAGKESITEESDEDPVLGTKNQAVKVTENLSEERKEYSESEVSESLSTKKQSIAYTSDKSEEWKSTKKQQNKLLKPNVIPVKDTFDKKDLPEGWTRGRIVRKSGQKMGCLDIYYYK